MSAKNRTSSGMLGSYLYNTDSVAERLAKEPDHNLRDSRRTNQTASNTTNGDATLTGQLDDYLNSKTEQVLLRTARHDQQGLKDGTRSYK